MRPKYRPCGNEDFSMIWSAACQQPGFSLSFMRISFAVARSGWRGSYAAATIPSSTATSKGWSSCNSLCPASATEVVLVASRLRRADLGLESVPLLPPRRSSQFGRRVSRRPSAQRVGPLATSRGQLMPRGEKSSCLGCAKSRGVLVCRCTSSHNQEDAADAFAAPRRPYVPLRTRREAAAWPLCLMQNDAKLLNSLGPAPLRHS